MGKRIILVLLILLGCIGGYSFVSGGNLVFSPDLRFVVSASDNIYIDSETPPKSVVVYQSNFDLKNAQVTSLCKISSKFLESAKGLYFFELDYSNDRDCRNGNIVLTIGDDTYASTIHKLNIVTDISMYENYIDYSSSQLAEYQQEILGVMRKNAIYKKYNEKQVSKYYSFLKGKKSYENAHYESLIIADILKKRENKYSSPVLGRSVGIGPNKVPNALRPYRAAYTDGIHHGWDIDGDLGDSIVALDDGIIVRIVDDFLESDFSKIVYGDNLTIEQELKNLDILRGNQLWLKTMKGEVVFYSHLSSVESGIEEGMMVERGTILGKTGVSGVPQEDYHDYHLHFAIMENPYDILKTGTYSFGDYMAWDWLTRGKSYSEVLQQQKNIFE